MRLGVNYPKGPLAWADAVGVRVICQVLPTSAPFMAKTATASRR
jgi:3-hydroxybutyryl-CoA dehydrogenase